MKYYRSTSMTKIQHSFDLGQIFAICPPPIRTSSRPRARGHGRASERPTPLHPGWGRTWKQWQPLPSSCRRWSGRRPAPPFLWWARRSWTCRQRCDRWILASYPQLSFFSKCSLTKKNKNKKHADTRHTLPCSELLLKRPDEAHSENMRWGGGVRVRRRETHYNIRNQLNRRENRNKNVFLCWLIWYLDCVFISKILIIFLYMVSNITLAHMGDSLPK